MKTKIYSIVLLILILVIFMQGNNVTNAIITSIHLFQSKIFPSLFPFMVLSPFFIHYGFFQITRTYLGPIVHKLFHISKNGAYLIFMSMLSGFPSSANYAKDLVNQELLTEEEAFHILLFSHFSNPIFILSMVPEKPYLVLFAHYLGNMLLGILLRKKSPTITTSHTTEIKPKSFFQIFSQSIENAIHNSLFVLGVISFFFMLTAIIHIPLFSLLAEVSQGLQYLNNLALSSKGLAMASAFLLSFGGMSVHLQVYGLLSNWNISYRSYLGARICHGILSVLIVFILF